jgi:HNH endonuclease
MPNELGQYTPREWNPRIVGEVAWVPLTQGYEAQIDLGDLPLVRAWSWSIRKGTNTHYATTNIPAPAEMGRRQTSTAMHRMLMGFPPKDPRQVDHINGDGLDNRRCNLREATTGQNMANKISAHGSSSIYKGVYRRKGENRWRAEISSAAGRENLGTFDNEEDAGRAYDARAIVVFGEYARLNFPDG